jgi:hypothetical protein
MIGRGRTVPASSRAVRALNAVLAALYLGTATLVAYFRLVTIPKVMARLAHDGAQVPGWFPVVFTFGPILAGLYLLIQGGRHLRRALGASDAGPRSR